MATASCVGPASETVSEFRSRRHSLHEHQWAPRRAVGSILRRRRSTAVGAGLKPALFAITRPRAGLRPAPTAHRTTIFGGWVILRQPHLAGHPWATRQSPTACPAILHYPPILSVTGTKLYRGRTAGHPTAPSQVPACAILPRRHPQERRRSQETGLARSVQGKFHVKTGSLLINQNPIPYGRLRAFVSNRTVCR